ncbi:hypothetical protein LguiB_026591 [Lonicera macranthoides]
MWVVKLNDGVVVLPLEALCAVIWQCMEKVKGGARSLVDVCSLKSTLWQECSFIKEIDFSIIDRISQNPKLVHVFNEQMVELEPLNSIQNNLDDCDYQNSDDIIIALPLNSHYNGDDNPDRGECNPHSGAQHLVASNPTLNSIKSNVNSYDRQSSKHTITEVPLDSHYDGDDNPDGGECNPHSGEQHLLASNPNLMENNDNKIKVDVTPIFCNG